jgi:hypothetical protein
MNCESMERLYVARVPYTRIHTYIHTYIQVRPAPDSDGEQRVKIHFTGWKSRFDHWAPLNSPRLCDDKKNSIDFRLDKYLKGGTMVRKVPPHVMRAIKAFAKKRKGMDESTDKTDKDQKKKRKTDTPCKTATTVKTESDHKKQKTESPRKTSTADQGDARMLNTNNGSNTSDIRGDTITTSVVEQGDARMLSANNNRSNTSDISGDTIRTSVVEDGDAHMRDMHSTEPTKGIVGFVVGLSAMTHDDVHMQDAHKNDSDTQTSAETRNPSINAHISRHNNTITMQDTSASHRDNGDNTNTYLDKCTTSSGGVTQPDAVHAYSDMRMHSSDTHRDNTCTAASPPGFIANQTQNMTNSNIGIGTCEVSSGGEGSSLSDSATQTQSKNISETKTNADSGAVAAMAITAQAPQTQSQSSSINTHTETKPNADSSMATSTTASAAGQSSNGHASSARNNKPVETILEFPPGFSCPICSLDCPCAMVDPSGIEPCIRLKNR